MSNWTSLAILSAAVQGAVNIIESHLLTRRMPGLQTFILPVGIFFLIVSLLLLILFPLPEGTDIWPILAAATAGAIRTIGLVITFYTLTREEVSRVIPITFTYPIFVAIFAIPFLGESLNHLQWLAIIIVVAGAVIVSSEKNPSINTTSLGRPFLLLFVASLLFALADIFTKYALGYLPFWNVFSLAVLALSTILIAVSARPGTIRQLMDMKQRNSSMALIFFNETLGVTGAMLQFRAMAMGPISLVSTICGTRPFFVAIYSIILGLILPGFLIKRSTRGVLALRLIATIMIVGGISIIYLT